MLGLLGQIIEEELKDFLGHALGHGPGSRGPPSAPGGKGVEEGARSGEEEDVPSQRHSKARSREEEEDETDRYSSGKKCVQLRPFYCFKGNDPKLVQI